MKKTFILLIVSCIIGAAFGQSEKAQLDTLLSTYSRLNKFNGSILVAKNGNVLLEKGYGFCNAELKISNDEKTIFQIGSLTKQFTSAIIMKLQGEGKLDVSDKLSKYFKDYPNGDSITIQHLLSHTSGIYSFTNDRSFMENEVTNPATREKMISLFKNKPLEFSPGTNWQYSNSGYLLLGYIIEDVAKRPCHEVVSDYIFKPLQMKRSGFDFKNLTDTSKATGYFVLNDKDIVPAPAMDPSVTHAAGALYSTAHDMHLWHQALEGNALLSEAQKEEIFTSVRNKYGYGWFIDSFEGKKIVSHSGGTLGFSSYITRIPEDDVCVIMLSNASDPLLQEIAQNALAILYHKPYDLPREKIAISLSEEKLHEYEGTYEIQPGMNVTMIVRDGDIVAEPAGQPSSVLYAEKEDHFFMKAPDMQIQFTRSNSEEIDGFILRQGSREMVCKKIN